MHILYVGSRLPARSETFVYREVFGLRQIGHSVSIASVRQPDSDLGSSMLDELGKTAEIVYRPAILVRGLLRSVVTPRVVFQAVKDIASSDPLTMRERVAVLFQAVMGMGLAGQARDLGIDHVHAHMANTPTGIAMYAAASLRVPFSFTGHAADLFRDRLLLEAKLERAAFVACISYWHRAFYQSLAEIPDELLPVVRCGIDLAEERPNVSNSRRSPAASVQLVTVGRLVEKKGIHFLLQALAMIETQFRSEDALLPALKLTVLGDGPERERLEETCHGLGLDEMVKFSGFQPNAVVRDQLKESDLFVLPCCTAKDGDKDGIPVVLMEAMAEGIPVISGDLPTVRELVMHEQTGLLVVPEDVLSLAKSIVSLVQSPEYAAKLAKAGQNLVYEEFSLEINITRLESAISLLKQSGQD